MSVFAAPSAQGQRELEAFTQRGAGPRTTFSLVLMAVTVAALAMSMDAVPRYSRGAFLAGIVLAAALAIVVGKLADATRHHPFRLVFALCLPALGGVLIGVVVQVLVLLEVGTSYGAAVKDLGGLVDTTMPGPWIFAGILLGGAPALLVSTFLLLAGRTLRRLVGHDASESFGVVFVGSAGVVAAWGHFTVDSFAALPLLLVGATAALTLLVALVVDGSRMRFLRRVYAGQGGSFDIVPRARFADDPNLAPLVSAARSGSVLVRIEGRMNSYRAAAAEPIALVGDTEAETLAPVVRRRRVSLVMLAAMALPAVLSSVTALLAR